MIRSPYATRMTRYGVRDMDNRKPTSQKRLNGRQFHPRTDFNPSKAEQKHFEKYLEATS